MGYTDTPGYAAGNYALPQFGEYDANRRTVKQGEFSWAAGTDTTAFVAAAASDSDGFVDVLVDTQEVVEAFNLGSTNQPVFVKGVWATVITAFTASVTTTFGDTDDADGYLPEADFGSTTTGKTVASSDEGPFSSNALYSLNGGRFYDGSSSDDSIDFTIGGADPAAGRGLLFVEYFACDNVWYGA